MQLNITDNLTSKNYQNTSYPHLIVPELWMQQYHLLFQTECKEVYRVFGILKLNMSLLNMSLLTHKRNQLSVTLKEGHF